MGEYSKKIGEHGEKIVQYLFKELLGFKYFRGNFDIPCVFPEEHSLKEGSLRKTHGIDGAISYHSPLITETLEIGIVSVKFSNNDYPNNPKTDFKDYFKELAWTLKCYNYSDDKQQVESSTTGVKQTNIVGVLFWLSNHQDAFESEIMSKISNSSFGGDELNFDKIIFVDNARIKFLIDVLQPIKERMGEENYDFVYPRTGMNSSHILNENFGKKCPLDFLAYDILPLRIKDGKDTYFLLANRANYDEKEFSRLVGLAKSFNRLEATSKTVISFPNFNELNHRNSVNMILSSLQDESFNNQIEVVNYNTDFRNL